MSTTLSSPLHTQTKCSGTDDHTWNCGAPDCIYRSVCTIANAHHQNASLWHICGPDCGNIPSKCPGDKVVKGHYVEHHEYCNDPLCTNPRGYNQWIRAIEKADTVVKMWRTLSRIIQYGAPGTQHEKKMQTRRFHRESVELKKELVDLCRPKVIEFIRRWATKHMPGEE